VGRRIKAQPDGACHLERTPSGQGSAHAWDNRPGPSCSFFWAWSFRDGPRRETSGMNAFGRSKTSRWFGGRVLLGDRRPLVSASKAENSTIRRVTDRYPATSDAKSRGRNSPGATVRHPANGPIAAMNGPGRCMKCESRTLHVT
jgi:hypothetical protein